MICASLAGAQTVSQGALDADVLILGEVHDNPMHHANQADLVARTGPAALVFEMLSFDQARAATPEARTNEGTLGAALDWEGSGWPDFAMYYPIFAAAPEAAVYGAAVPRGAIDAALTGGPAAGFGRYGDVYGLDAPLPEQQQQRREALQLAAHCDALPAAALPGMVSVQRLRDAALARAALQAYADTGGPVAVITGNGHARKDWGVPAVLAAVAPDVSVWSVGQAEEDAAPEGGFDDLLSTPAAERDDPCLAFQ